MNIIDSLSSIAVYLMWEWNELQPIVIWRNIPWIEYTNEDNYKEIEIESEKDLYFPILKPLFFN